jgi:hypothetical protein
MQPIILPNTGFGIALIFLKVSDRLWLQRFALASWAFVHELPSLSGLEFNLPFDGIRPVSCHNNDLGRITHMHVKHPVGCCAIIPGNLGHASHQDSLR